MEKNETEKQFDALVSHIWAFFKPLGYRKKGNNFRFYNAEGKFGKIVNFQKSQWGSKTNISFTVNTGVYFADYCYYLINQKKDGNFTEYECAIRNRIGDFNIIDKRRDKWYNLTENTNIERLKTELELDFTNAISYFSKINTKEDAFHQLITNRNFECGIFAISKIKTLFYNGYAEQAMCVLERAMKNSNESFKLKFEKLSNDLKSQTS